MPENQEIIAKSSHIRGLEYEHEDYNKQGIAKKIFTSSKGASIDTLYNTVKHSPECIACISAIIEDIMADGWRFDSKAKQGKSKSAIEDAQNFELKSRFYKVLSNAILDLLITGNAYILKLSVDEGKIKTLIQSVTDNIAKSFAVDISKAKKDEIFQFIKQETSKPKDLQLLKASTIKINFDETGVVKSYQQTVKNNPVRVFDAKDVIHLSLMNIGGQPYGFTPLETLLSDIATLIFAKEFAGKFFENDGIPFFMFKMPEAQPDDHNYKLLKQELKELKKDANKYKSIVVTGNIDAEQINKFNKDMEFPKLIMHFTQIILLAWGVPAHRVNLTIDVKSSSTELGKIESGYFKRIAFLQRLIQDPLNLGLWDSFGVKMSFKESYKIDEMREAQVVQIISQAGIVTVEEAREMIGLEPEMPKGTPIKQNNNQNPNGAINSVGDQSAINNAKDKKREQGLDGNPKKIPTDNKVKSK